MRHPRLLPRSLLATVFVLVSTVFMASAQADVWREGAPMSTARANAGGVLVGDDLYLAGSGGHAGGA